MGAFDEVNVYASKCFLFIAVEKSVHISYQFYMLSAKTLILLVVFPLIRQYRMILIIDVSEKLSL